MGHPERAPGWRTRAAVAGGFIVFGMVEGSWSSRIPLIRQQLHLSDLGLSVALTGPPIGLILATTVAPRIHRRVGGRRLLGAMMAGGAAGLLLPALAWSLWSLLLALVIWGTVLGLLDLSMNAQGVALERRDGRSVMTRLHATYSLCVLAFAPLGGLANHLGAGPVAHFAVISAVGVALTLPLRPALLPDEETNGTGTTGADGAAQEIPRAGAVRSLGLLAAIGFCAMLAEGSVGNWSGVLLHRQDHASLSVSPLALAAFNVGMVIGRVSGDSLIIRLGYRRVARWAALLGAVGMVLAAGSSAVGPALGGYAVLGLGLAVLVPITFALAGRVPGVPPVQAMSRLTMFTYGGLFAGPPLIGLVAGAIGLRTALISVAGLLVITAALMHRAVAARVGTVAGGDGAVEIEPL
jgi:MFS family permease